MYEIFFNWCADMSKNTVKNGKQKNRVGGSKLGIICSRIRKKHFAVALCVFAFRCGKPAIGLPAANKKQIGMKIKRKRRKDNQQSTDNI